METPEAIPNSDVVTESKTNEQIIAELLGGYDKPLETEPEKITDDEPAEVAPDTDDKSDPAKYYQTGKKKGQPRKRIKLEQNSDSPDNVNFSDVLTGAMFISLIDMLLPLLIEVVNNRFTKNKIKAKDLSMDAEQRKRLTPLADGVVKRWNIQANPALLLIIGMAGVYGMTYAMLVQDQKHNDK